MSQNTVTVNVAHKSLKIACPVGEESALLAAAQEVSSRFSKMHEKNSASSSAEQTMLMTALNLAYDLLQLKESSAKEKLVLESKIELLKTTIEQAITTTDKEKVKV